MAATVQNTAELRSYNTRKVIEYMSRGASTKKAVARDLGLSFATVSNICNRLLSEGILEEKGEDESSGGRIPKLLSLRASARLTICLYLLRRDVYEISVADLLGAELASISVDARGGLTLADLVLELRAAASRMLDELGAKLTSVIGMCVAAPGICNRADGLIVNSTDPLFENQPLGAILGKSFGLPVYIENESKLLVMAAAAGKDGSRSLSDVIYLYVADGLGVGIISGGRLVVGSRGLGGEIEHMPLGPRNYGCYCGQRGCVETELSEKGFLRKWAEAVGGAEGSGEGAAAGEWKDFLAALAAGDEAATAVAAENGRLLGRLISVLVNIFDPELVYVGGIVGDFFETIRPEVESELGLRMVAGGLRKVGLESDADYRAMVLRGCAARAFSGWRI